MPSTSRPNIILIMTDDQGYGDLGCYGSTVLRTPNIDRLADEGIRFTDFYSCAPVCTPARANIVTGRYAQRIGLPGVLFPYHREGIPDGCSTTADCLKRQDYATAMFGKWHLGCQPEHRPTRHGFDEYFGLLYSNDMQPEQLYQNEQIIEEPVHQASLTRRYTEGAIDFARRAGDKPFFIYMAHTMPHIPLHVEPAFRGRSKGGLYGDTIECIDHYVGLLLEALKDMGRDDDTMVIFTSDNGPWFEGSVGNLRGRKFSVYEGGIRMPMIVRWPRGIPAGQTSGEVGCFMDLLPTFVSLAGGKLPEEGEPQLDGLDISQSLRGGKIDVDRTLFFYQGWNLNACRQGRWKLHVAEGRGGELLTKEMPQLFDVVADPGENYNLALERPEVVERLKNLMDEFAREANFQRREYTRFNA